VRTFLSLFLLSVLIFLSCPEKGSCEDINDFLFEPSIGKGDVWSMGSAFTGVAIDSGFSGGVRNPALSFVKRNEISGEGDAWNDIISQSHLESPSPRVGVGSIGYLVNIGTSIISFGYVAQTRFQSGVSHSQADIISRAELSSYSVGYAKNVSKKLNFGMDVGWLGGHANYGAKIETTDKDTSIVPSVFRTRIGLSGKTESLNWGIVVSLPQFGKYTIERPLDIRNKTYETELDYSGGMGIVAGLGRELGGYIIETDFTFIETGSVKLDGENLENSAPVISLGVAGRHAFSENVEAVSGFRFRLSDPEERTYLLWGFGAKYKLNKDIDLFGSMQLMFPTVSNSNDTLLDDVTPWCLRGGFSFHGE